MSEDKNDDDFDEIKVILLGESGIGKTSLINVCIGKYFSEDEKTSITNSFVRKKIKRGKKGKKKKQKEYILNIWDTAGQETYRAMTKLFIKNSKIIFFTYAINCRKTFEELSYWVSTVKEILGDEPVLGLVANKSDLYNEEEVSKEEGIKYAEEIGAKFKFVSAKTNPGAFTEFIEVMLDEYLSKNKSDFTQSFSLNEEKKSGGCCLKN